MFTICIYENVYMIVYSVLKMLREGKHLDRCLFKSVLIYLFTCEMFSLSVEMRNV